MFSGETVVGLRLPSGRGIDLRNEPPFHPTSPCLWCGCLDDKGHDNTKHIVAWLGEALPTP